MAEAFFYSIAHIQGTGIMVDLFGTDSPYSLPAAEIVDRLLALGCTPIVNRMQREPFPQFGRTEEVQRGDQTFLVAVSRDAQLIGVQEIRTHPYAPESPS